MTRSRISRFITGTLCLALLAGAALPLQAVTVNFSQVDYPAAPGQTIELVVRFSEPVPNGLEGYALRLDFDNGLLAFNDIAVAPELDFDFLLPGANTNTGPGFATVDGFTEIGEPAYTGIDFVVFTVTVSAAAIDGVYNLVLGPMEPEADNFVDGTGAVIDDDLVFGSATLTVSSIQPAISYFRINREADQMVIRFSATPGFDYLIEYSPDLATDSWSPLTTVLAPGDGQVEVAEPLPAPGTKRFYRASPQ